MLKLYFFNYMFISLPFFELMEKMHGINFPFPVTSNSVIREGSEKLIIFPNITQIKNLGWNRNNTFSEWP
jgi:hypothetical protein